APAARAGRRWAWTPRTGSRASTAATATSTWTTSPTTGRPERSPPTTLWPCGETSPGRFAIIPPMPAPRVAYVEFLDPLEKADPASGEARVRVGLEGGKESIFRPATFDRP